MGQLGILVFGSLKNEKIGSDSVCVGIRKFPFDSRGRREIVLKILEIDESNPSLSPADVVNKLISAGILHKNKNRSQFGREK